MNGAAISVRRIAARFLAFIALPALLLPACGGSEFDFVGSPDRKAYFKIPLDWKEFSRRDLLAASGLDLSDVTQQTLPWLVAFDSAPRPSADHVLELAEAPDHPVVLAQARQLDFASRDQISLGTIRNEVYPVDELIQNDAAEIRDYEELVLDEGYRGIRIEFDVTLGGNAEITSGNEVIRVHQIGIVDPATETMYLFAIRCESHCFDENDKVIDQIVESWTVKEL